MGRKSNAKKERREKEKKKTAPDETKKVKKSRKKPALKLKLDKKKIFGGILTVIMFAIIVSVGYFLFQKGFKARPLAKLLPADSTVLLLEINSNLDHKQLAKTFKLLEKYPDYSLEKVLEKIETRYALNYESDLKDWLHRQVGFAILKSEAEPGRINLIQFAEFKNRLALKDFLNRRGASKNSHGGQETYMIDGPLYLTFLNEYLVFSDVEEAIYELIDQQNSPKLYSTSKYRKIDNNLPLNRTAFFYLDFHQVTDGIFQFFPLLSEKGLSMEIVAPFLKLLDAEGVALIALDDNFAVQSFLSLDRKLLENINYLQFQEKYDADLTSYVMDDALAFWGGENLEGQLKRLLEILASGNQSTLSAFDTLINNYTQKYLGPDINFKHDVLSLFQQEYAFVIEKIDEKNSYKLLLELDSPQADGVKIHELANNFASIGAVFEPKIVEHTLEDGTVSKEIVAVPEEIVKSESKYLDTTIYEMKVGDQGWGVYYALFDNLAVIANNSDGVRKTLDLEGGGLASLRSADSFNKNILPALRSSDEVSYFNLANLWPEGVLGEISSGRNYFNDGVVTINYISIK